VVKAQVLAGGRGKGHFTNDPKRVEGGGIAITACSEMAEHHARRMLGNRLVTIQTPPEGLLVKKTMVANSFPIKRTAYLAFLHDFEHASPVVISCREGGVDIEDVARKDPSLIHKQPVDIDEGLTDEQARRVAEFLGFSDEGVVSEAVKEVKRLYRVFMERDAVLLEVNPFAEIEGGTGEFLKNL